MTYYVNNIRTMRTCDVSSQIGCLVFRCRLVGDLFFWKTAVVQLLEQRGDAHTYKPLLYRTLLICRFRLFIFTLFVISFHKRWCKKRLVTTCWTVPTVVHERSTSWCSPAGKLNPIVVLPSRMPNSVSSSSTFPSFNFLFSFFFKKTIIYKALEEWIVI